MHHTKSATLFFLTAVIIGLCSPAYSLTGDPVMPFGAGSLRIPGEGQFSAVAMQPDGKIVAAGSSYNGSNYDIIIARYFPDGAPDPTFGSGGSITTAIGTDDDAAYAVAIDGFGNIVVAGTSQSFPAASQFTIVRYDSAGTLDYSFGGGDGYMTFPASTGDQVAYAVAMQADNKIVAAGSFYNITQYDIFIARLDETGAADSSFGPNSDGTIIQDIAGFNDEFFALAVKEGKILAAGYSNDGTSDDFALARYTSEGDPDTSFDGDGLVITDIQTSSTDAAYGLALQEGGFITAAGNSRYTDSAVALVRYNSFGAIDTSFSGGIITATIGPGSSYVEDIQIQPDGKIVAAGRCGNGIDSDPMLLSFMPDGTFDFSFGKNGKSFLSLNKGDESIYAIVLRGDGRLYAAGVSGGDPVLLGISVEGFYDTSFSQTGRVLTSIAQDDTVYAVLSMLDGSIVAAGQSATGDGLKSPLVRYTSDGHISRAWDNNSFIFAPFADDSAIHALAVDSAGRIIAAGSSQYDFALARFLDNGMMDTSFNGSGWVKTPSTSDEAIFGLAVKEPEGKIIAAGYSYDTTKYDFAVARYNSDGSLDPTFSGGKVITPVGAESSKAMAVAVTGDGRVVAAGYQHLTADENQSDFALVRYDAGGVLDTTFDSDGIFDTFNLSGSREVFNAVKILPGNKILAAGTTNRNGTEDFVLACFNENGSPNTGFAGGSGYITLDFGGTTDDVARSLLIQPDGSIILTGVSYQPGVSSKFAAARFTSIGTLDASFGNAGKLTVAPGPEAQDEAFASCFQPNGDLVMAGKSQILPGKNVFALARYQAFDQMQAHDVFFSSVQPTQATINWTRGNGTACAVFLKAANSGMPTPQDGITNPVNSIFSDLDNAGPGWQCVFSGAGAGSFSSNNVTVTNLQPGTVYRAMVCEYVTSGPGTESYNVNSAPGNPVNSGAAALGWSQMASGTTERLRSIWGTSPTDVFAVGDAGTILHFDGTVWGPQASGVPENFSGVWGSSNTDVFAVGFSNSGNISRIMHYNGASWSVMTPPGGVTQDLRAVWGTASNDVFIAGDSTGSTGTILHYDGIEWTSMLNPIAFPDLDSLYGIWGSSPTDVYAVGQNYRLLHYDGIFWTSTQNNPGTAPFYGIWGSSPTDIFTVGGVVSSTKIMSYNGSTWSDMDTAALGNISLQGVWGVSANNIYAVGNFGNIFNFDGSSWQTMTNGSTATLYGVYGFAADNVFAVGDSGTILHYGPYVDTSTTSTIVSPTTTVMPTTTSTVFATSTVFTSTTTIFETTTTTSVQIPGWDQMFPGMTSASLHDIWGSSETNVFAIGDMRHILQYNGTGWSVIDSGPMHYLRGIWGSSSSDIFIVGGASGYRLILHFDGISWTEQASGTEGWELHDIWGSSNTDVFAVGSMGSILHYSGSVWDNMTSSTAESLNGLWGTTATDVYAVGAAGTILQYNGSSWSSVAAVPTTNELTAIWGSSNTDIFAVGFSGTILHYDGLDWTGMASPTTENLFGIWGTGSGDVYAVGSNRTILHYKNGFWNVLTTGPYEYLYGIWGTAQNNVFAVGGSGLILHFSGGPSGQVLTVPDTGQTQCYSDTALLGECPVPGGLFYGQDASYPINPPKYRKLDIDGDPLPDNATAAMVLDELTGLVWENKTDDGSVHDGDNMYAWQDAQDTFIAQLNADQFGGRDDWRLPTPAELHTITNLGMSILKIDTNYFSFTKSSDGYWTSATYAGATIAAWQVGFGTGKVITANKTTPLPVRAVAGGSAAFPNNFFRHTDGTVCDARTGLMWQQAAAPELFDWQAALGYSENLILNNDSQWTDNGSNGSGIKYEDWRLPSAKELMSIADYGRYNPAIDDVAFTGIQPLYWSSTTVEQSAIHAWALNFTQGDLDYGAKTSSYGVRTVRGGQTGVTGKVSISSFTASSQTGPTPFSISFNCTASTDLGFVSEYRWDFDGDNLIDEVTAGPSVFHMYTTPGAYKASVLALNDKGAFAASQSLTINAYSLTTTTIFPTGPVFSPMASNTSQWLDAVWGSSGTDVYAVGDTGTIMHYDGSTWSIIQSITSMGLNDVWGNSETDIFAAGANGALLHDNDTWFVDTSFTGEPLNGLWGSSASDVYAVGNMGRIGHYDGTSWSPVDMGSEMNQLNGIWGSSDSDVFVVGSSGKILHYNGTSWSDMSSGVSEFLYDVWGSSPTDVFVCGAMGLILHYDGASWSTMTTGTLEYLRSIWGSSSSDVFAVGNNGTILHYDGAGWQHATSNTSSHLTGVWGHPGIGVVAVGEAGTIVRLGPPGCTDADGDDFFAGTDCPSPDCNDNDSLVHDSVIYYHDVDNDGYGGAATTSSACSATPPFGYSANSLDCDDNQPSVNPGRTEICNNGIDDDCNGATADICGSTTTSSIASTTTTIASSTSTIAGTTTTTAPSLDFTATPLIGMAPLEVQFTASGTASAASGLLWEFGDGSTGSGSMPKHVYQASGCYDVSLALADSASASAGIKTTKLYYIKVVENAPVADFKASVTQGQAPLTVIFTDISTGTITERLWDLGSGEAPGLKTIMHTFTAAGQYSIGLKVTGPEGSDRMIKQSCITVEPGNRTSAISGHITGISSGSVDVSLSGETVNFSTTTDAAGSYSFAGVPNGLYRITPILRGSIFDPPGTEVRVFGADLVDIDFTASPAGPTIGQLVISPARISAGSDISVLLTAPVTHSAGSDAISSVTADLSSIGGSQSAALRDDGTGGDAAAGDGIYTLTASVAETTEPGLKPLSVTAEDFEGMGSRAFAGLNVYKEFQGTLIGQGGTASFNVTNSVPGQTIRFVLNQNGGSGSSGNSGSSLKISRTDPVCSPNMIVTSPGGVTYDGQNGEGQSIVEIPNAQEGQWNVQLANPCDTTLGYELESEMAGSGMVTGIIIDSRTGDYLDGVSVGTSAGLGTQTESGAYVLLHPSGFFLLNTSAQGYLPSYKSLTVGSGSVVEMNIALDNGTQNSGCLFRSTMQESSRLQTLRKFRDSVLGQTAQGRRCIGLYYKYAREILVCMNHDKQFAAELLDTVNALFPLVETMLQGGQAIPDEKQRRALLGCLEKLRNRAQPGLGSEITACMKKLKSKQALNRLFN